MGAREKTGSGKKLSTFEFFLGISTDWVPKKSAEKPVQLASTFSLFFSAALKLLLSSFKNRAKIQMFSTQTELNLIRWHARSALCTLKKNFYEPVFLPYLKSWQYPLINYLPLDYLFYSDGSVFDQNVRKVKKSIDMKGIFLCWKKNPIWNAFFFSYCYDSKYKLWKKNLVNWQKYSFYSFFVDLHVLYKLWTRNCSASSANQNKNNFLFITRTRHVKSTKNRPSNSGLIEETMDLSCTSVCRFKSQSH